VYFFFVSREDDGGKFENLITKEAQKSTWKMLKMNAEKGKVSISFHITFIILTRRKKYKLLETKMRDFSSPQIKKKC
jgi:hypothetical protein